jgi:UDP-GlcNAc:undecaprenyl-phosphate/decaprenyl-phosphate GlcNAc-1-phosphate transferase
MLELIAYALLAGVIALLVTAAAVPLVSRLALAFRAVDYPDERKIHRGAVPRLGGVAIGFGVVLGAGAVSLARWGEWGERVARSDLVVFVLAGAIVFLVGLVDDLVSVSVGRKFAAELLAALLIALVGWQFTSVTLPDLGTIQLGALGGVITVVWIVGVTNAINLIDGLDGLAGGVVAIIALSLVVYSMLQQNFFSVILMAAVAGGCFGFLRYNWRGQIFLGDAGSLSLGFVLAVMTVHSSIKAHAAVAILVPLLALGVPVMDTLLVMLARFAEQSRGRFSQRFLRMFHADRNHLHYLLESWTGRRDRVVRMIYALVGLFCVAALLVATSHSAAAGLTLALVELIVIVLVRRMGLAARMREISETQRHELRELLGQSGTEGSTARE